MNYRLRISPTAQQSLTDVLARHPYPDIIEEFWASAVRAARNPNAHARPKVHGRDWFPVTYRHSGWTLYLQVAFQLNDEEGFLEILDVGPLQL